jgi:hypothetical protein
VPHVLRTRTGPAIYSRLMPAPTESARRSRIVLVAAAAVLVVIAGIIAWQLPQTTAPPAFSATSPSIADDAAVIVLLQIDAIDATTGRVSTRVSVHPGPAIPTEGAKVLVGSRGQHVVTVSADVASVDQPVVFDFDEGSVAAYPFDRYVLSELVAAIPVTSTESPGSDGTSTLPVQVIGNSSAFGFTVEDATTVDANPSYVDLRLLVERTTTHRIWATAMMAIFWALAIAAATVALVITLRARRWETRHLAWLGSMIFALAAFRTTAPGGPPLGVFLDTAAFLWAEALIVLSLVALVVVYLSRRSDELE